MAYIVSYESQSTEYPKYIRTKTGVDANGSILIKGGANVIDKTTMKTAKGAVTEVSKEDLDFLQTQYLFNFKIEKGFYEIVEGEKKATEKAKKNRTKKDGSAQLTAKDFQDSGQNPPIVGSN